jgi:hypothetical protein
MSNSKAFAVFVRAIFSVLRILTQILTFCLMITWNGTLELYHLILNPLSFHAKGSELDTSPYFENSAVQSCSIQEEYQL